MSESVGFLLRNVFWVDMVRDSGGIMAVGLREWRVKIGSG